MGRHAVLDPEPGGAAGIVAGGRVDGGADHRGDQKAVAHLAHQVGRALRALGQGDVADRGRGRRGRAAAGRGGRGQAELAAGGKVEGPALKDAVPDDGAGRGGQALGVEGARGRAAAAQRILDQVDARGQHRLAEKVARPGGAAGDGAARDRGQQVRDQRGSDAFVEQDREAPGRRAPGAGAGQRAFCGQPADLGGGQEVGGEDAAVAVMVALHRAALAGDGGDVEPVAGAFVAAGEAVAGSQVDLAAGIAGAGAVGAGDAGDGAGGGLGLARGGFQCGRRGFRGRVGQFEPRGVPVAGQLRRVGKADEGILGRLAGHGDGPFGHRRHGRGAGVRGRDAGLAPADQDAQPDLGAFCALGLLEPALAHADRDRGRHDRHGIGGLGPGGPGCVEQRGGEGGGVVGHSGLRQRLRPR